MAEKINLEVNLDPSIDRAKLEKILGALKKSLGSLGDEIKIDPGAFDGLESEVAGTNAELDELRKNVDNLEKKGAGGSALPRALGFVAVTGAITQASQALQAFTKPLAELDTQVKNIGTLGVEGFEEFRDLALEASKEIPDSAATIAEATYNAISAGIQGTNAEIIEFTKTAGKAAVAGVSDTNTAVNAGTTVLNAYKLEASQASTVFDTFFAGIKLGKTSFAEMSSGLASIIPAASAAGVQFKEVSGVIAQMTSLGVPTAQATTQMRAALVELQKPAGPLAKVLEKAGLSADEMRKSLAEKGFVATMQQVEETASSMGLSLTQVFGSAEAASAGLLVTGANAEEANRKLKAVDVEIAAQAATGAFEVASTGIEAQTTLVLNTIQASVQSMLGAFGDSFVVITNSAAQVTPLIAGLANVGALIPEGTGGKIKDLAVSLISKLVPAAVATTTANGATTISFSALWASALGPITAVVAGIAAVTAGIYFLVDALNESAEERLEEAEATKKATEEQIRQNQAEQDRVKGVQTLAERFEELAEKTERTKAEDEELRKVQNLLDQQYPDLIDQTRDFKDNLGGVAEIGKLTTEALGKLGEENAKLAKQLQANTRLVKAAQRDVALEELRDVTDTFGRSVGKALGSLLELNTYGLADASIATDDLIDRWEVARTTFEKSLFNAESIDDINRAKGGILDVVNDLKKAGLETDTFLELSAGIEKASAATLDYFKSLKNITDEEPTAPVVPDATPDPVKTDKELKSYLDKIRETRRATAEIYATLSADEIADEEKRALELARLQNERTKAQVEGEIENARKLKAGKDISAKEQTELVTALNEKLVAVEADGQAKIEATRAKFALERYKADRARSREELAIAGEIASGKVRQLEAIEARSAEEQISILERTRDARLEAIRATSEREVSELVDKNEKVVSEQRKLEALISRGASEEQIREQATALAEARLQAYNDPRVKAVVEEQQREEIATAEETTLAIQATRIAGITDGAIREREQAIYEARRLYEQRIAEAKGNQDIELQAFAEFLDAKRRAEEQYYRESSAAFVAFETLRDTLFEKLREGFAEDNTAKVDEVKKRLGDEEKNLLESLRNQETSYRDFSSQIVAIRAKANEELAKLSDPEIFAQFLEGLSSGFSSASEQFATASRESFDTFVSTQQAGIEYERQLVEKRREIARLEAEGKVEEAKKANEELDKLRKNADEADKQSAEARAEIFANLAVSTAASLGELVASGEATFASFANTILDSALSLLEKQIPIWVAGIFGTSVAELSLGGLAVAAGLTASLYALVGAAKASLGRAKGEVRIQGPGSQTSDDIPRFLSRDESVLTARATLAPGNEEAFRWANRTGRSLSEYYAMKRGTVTRTTGRDIVGSDARLDVLTKRVEETNERLDKVVRYVSRETFGRQKVELEAKIDLAKLEKKRLRNLTITNAKA